MMKRTSVHVALLLSVSLILLFTNLGATKLWDRDEPRNFGCAVEMSRLGDWVTPIFNDELRGQKPVLVYWLMMSAISVFGVNEFSARFWSAVLGSGTVLCTYFMASRLFNRKVGLLSGLILVTSLMFEVASRIATPDATLIFCVALAMTVFVFGATRKRSADSLEEQSPPDFHPGHYPATWKWIALIYCVMGFGLLAKGPIALILPTAIIGMFLLLQNLSRREVTETGKLNWIKERVIACVRPFYPWYFLKTCWQMKPFTAIACSLAIALPWYIWVAFRTDGEFIKLFLLQENFARATSSMEGHSGGIFYYTIAILFGFFPWSIFAIPIGLAAYRRLKEGKNWSPGVVFSICWIGVFVIAFSLAKTKLPSYVTPCYPALAMLCGLFIYDFANNALLVPKFWIKTAYVILGLIGLGMMVSLPLVSDAILPGTGVLGLIGLIPLTGSVAALICHFRNRDDRASWATFVTAGAMCFALLSMAPSVVDDQQQFHKIATQIKQNESYVLGSYGKLEASWVCYADRPIVEIDHELFDEATVEKIPEREHRWMKKTRVSTASFLETYRKVLVIVPASRLEEFLSRGDREWQELERVPYFLKNEDLILLKSNIDVSIASENELEHQMR